MANTQKYLNHLLQRTGITPACSEEERLAAEELAGIFRNHGFDPEVQEFTAAPSNKLAIAVMGILVFLGALFMGFGGFLGGLGFVLSLAGAALYGMERTGHPFLSKLGTSGVSQNVIAYHKAEGPLASPRNRPVVVVAHYDSPRGDIMAQMPYANYRVSLGRVLPVAMFVPIAVAILRLFPFPGFLKVILWLAAIVVALVPLAFAVAAIVNNFVLPYTSGSVCNKSSVATMLGVMDAVAPYKGADEFPDDVPFEQYFGEQKRRAADAARAAAAYAEQQGDAPVVQYGEAQVDEPVNAPQPEAASEPATAAEPEDADTDAAPVDPFGVIAPVEEDENMAESDEEPIEVSASEHEDDAAVEAPAPAPAEVSPSATVTMSATDIAQTAAEVDAAAEEESAVEEVPEAEAEETESSIINVAGNYRYGKDVISSLGMLPKTCEIEYDEGQMPEPPTDNGGDAAQNDTPAEPVSATAPVQPTAQMASFPQEEDAAPVDTEGYATQNDYYETAEPMAYAHSTYEESESGFERVTEGLSSFGDKAAGFFNKLIKRGKDMVDSFESARAAEEESWEDEAPEQDVPAEAPENVSMPADEPAAEVIPPVDATMTFEPMADQTAMFESQSDGAPAEGADGQDAAAPQQTAEASEKPEPVETEPVQSVSATVSFDRTAIAPAIEDDAADATVVTEETVAAPQQKYSTQIFTMPTTDPVVEEVEKQPDTVDSLMAEISSHIAAETAKNPAPAPQMVSPAATVAQPPVQTQAPNKLNAVPDPSLPSMQQANPASRASLFDLPDPAAADADPLGERQAPAQVPAPAADQAQAPRAESELPVIHAADAAESAPAAQKPKKKGLGGLFGRKKKKGQQSMSDWLGVEDGFDAKNSGRDIGSWDNFEDDDWKGGAASSDGASAEEMVSAVASLGDDELLGHDIWFVATGASERGNAGMKAFLETHRDKLRGVFFINLESIGAGRVSMVATEGGEHVMKGDRRIMNLVSRVSSAFHTDYAAVDMPFAQTDAHAVMESSLRALTIAGIDGPRFACSRTDEDAPHNIDPSNVAMTAEVVTEVIRRS